MLRKCALAPLSFTASRAEMPQEIVRRPPGQCEARGGGTGKDLQAIAKGCLSGCAPSEKGGCMRPRMNSFSLSRSLRWRVLLLCSHSVRSIAQRSQTSDSRSCSCFISVLLPRSLSKSAMICAARQAYSNIPRQGGRPETSCSASRQP